MATTLLASSGDVATRLRRELSEDELHWIDGVLEEASIRVAAFCGQHFELTVPDEVRVVTSRVAARALTATRTDSATSLSDQADVWQRTVQYSAGSTSGGVWLTAEDKRMLRRFTQRGVVSVRTW